MNLRGQAEILAAIEELNKHGSWTGKTHIIKTLYLLKVLGEVEVPFSFLLYKHGPYSFDVENELEVMRSYAAVEGQALKSGYGESLSKGQNSKYALAKEPLNRSEKQSIARICRLTGKKDVKELERLATAAYVYVEEKTRDPQKLAKRIHQLKPHVSESEALAALTELRPFLPA